MYRVARNYDQLSTYQAWDWYLWGAFNTALQVRRIWNLGVDWCLWMYYWDFLPPKHIHRTHTYNFHYPVTHACDHECRSRPLMSGSWTGPCSGRSSMRCRQRVGGVGVEAPRRSGLECPSGGV